jgi:hypothetical protein
MDKTPDGPENVLPALSIILHEKLHRGAEGLLPEGKKLSL